MDVLAGRFEAGDHSRGNSIGSTTGGADATVNRFKKFFGDVKGKRFFFTNGLESAALKHLETIQVLRTWQKSCGWRLNSISSGSREFTLVPWRPALERQLCKTVAGNMRGDGSIGSSIASVADQLSLDCSLFSRNISNI